MAIDPNPRATAATGTTLTGTRWRHRASGAEGQVVSTSTEMKPGWPAPCKTVTLCATIDPKREGTPFQVHAHKQLIHCCELQGAAIGYVDGPCPIHGGPTYVDMPYTSDDLVLTPEQLEEDWECLTPPHGWRPGRPEMVTTRNELRAALFKADPVTIAAVRFELWKLDQLNSYSNAHQAREEVERAIQAITLALFPL